MTNSEEISYIWAAGLFDGEGCFRIIKNPSYYARLTVHMSHYPAIERLMNIFQVGHIHKGRTSPISVHKPSWAWTCTKKEDILTVITLIYPYLFVKQPEADVVIKFLQTDRQDTLQLMNLYSELSNLNRS